MKTPTTIQLKAAIRLTQQRDRIERQLQRIFGGSGTTDAEPRSNKRAGAHQWSAAARNKLSIAMKKRWAARRKLKF